MKRTKVIRQEPKMSLALLMTEKAEVMRRVFRIEKSRIRAEGLNVPSESDLARNIFLR